MTAHPFDKSTAVLDYGSTIKDMNSQKIGTFDVALGEETGTVVTGKYFTSLMSCSTLDLPMRLMI